MSPPARDTAAMKEAMRRGWLDTGGTPKAAPVLGATGLPAA
jgi:hypothetical protein